MPESYCKTVAMIADETAHFCAGSPTFNSDHLKKLRALNLMCVLLNRHTKLFILIRNVKQTYLFEVTLVHKGNAYRPP